MQTIRNSGSLKDAEETLSARIMSMDRANDLLVNERWESTALEDIVDRALTPFRSQADNRFIVQGPHVRVPPRLAIGFALALHELSTNAAKYGALSVPEGHVKISWKVVDGWKPDRLHVCWEECDGPLVVPPSRVGFGTKLIKRVLASEINGAVELDYRPAGVYFEAIAPLPERGDQP